MVCGPSLQPYAGLVWCFRYTEGRAFGADNGSSSVGTHQDLIAGW